MHIVGGSLLAAAVGSRPTTHAAHGRRLSPLKGGESGLRGVHSSGKLNRPCNSDESVVRFLAAEWHLQRVFRFAEGARCVGVTSTSTNTNTNTRAPWATGCPARRCSTRTRPERAGGGRARLSRHGWTHTRAAWTGGRPRSGCTRCSPRWAAAGGTPAATRCPPRSRASACHATARCGCSWPAGGDEGRRRVGLSAGSGCYQANRAL